MGGKHIGDPDRFLDVKDEINEINEISKSNFTKSNQTEIAFIDNVGLDKISDFFVSKNTYNEYKSKNYLCKKHKLKNDSGNDIDILEECRNKCRNKCQDDEEWDGLFDKMILLMFDKVNIKPQDSKIEPIRNLVFHETLKFPNTDDLDFEYRGSVEKGEKDIWYWFGKSNGVRLEGEKYKAGGGKQEKKISKVINPEEKPDEEANEGENADKGMDVLLDVIIVSWLNQVESLLNSVIHFGVENMGKKYDTNGHIEETNRRKNIIDEFNEAVENRNINLLQRSKFRKLSSTNSQPTAGKENKLKPKPQPNIIKPKPNIIKPQLVQGASNRNLVTSKQSQYRTHKNVMLLK
jgi:hypothetical protein